uniref:Uncharacterized protein n=1 Tax=Rhizophora mucronata TaxID=61149 RepID=A0A2P2IKU7_RHIMU
MTNVAVQKIKNTNKFHNTCNTRYFRYKPIVNCI